MEESGKYLQISSCNTSPVCMYSDNTVFFAVVANFFAKSKSRKYEIIFLGVPIGELGGRFKISFRGLNVTCGLAGLFVSQRISTKVKIILGRCCYFS
jgi:hypothetical protein